MRNIPSKMIVLAIAVAGVLCFVGCSQSDKRNNTGGVPRFAVASADIVSPVELVTNETGKVEVQLRLSKARADELRNFAQKNAQAADMEIIFGSTAIIKPGMQCEMALSNDTVRVTSPSSDSGEVLAIGESLRRK